MRIIAPSLLSADFTRLADEMGRLRASGARILHLDVMDGCLVPNITFGYSLVSALRPLAPEVVFDAHLMVTHPLDYIDKFCNAGVDMLTVHLECADGAEECIDRIRSHGVLPGISIKPDTPASAVFDLLDKVGLVLVMSVEPGFGGQKLIPSCLRKAEELRRAAADMGIKPPLLSVDGGINTKTCDEAAANGFDILVAGSTTFGSADLSQAITALGDDRRPLAAADMTTAGGRLKALLSAYTER